MTKTLPVKPEIKQVAVRLTPNQWMKVNHYLIDHNIKFQALVIELLHGKIGLK